MYTDGDALNCLSPTFEEYIIPKALFSPEQLSLLEGGYLAGKKANII